MSSVPSFMKRSSFTTNNGRRGSQFRSSMLGIPRDQTLDIALDDFDRSLGCPLDKYENATLALVGGKALQCWRLMKHGFPVPNAFIIPTYVYSLHVQRCGVMPIITELMPNIMKGGQASRENNETKLAVIREKIMSTPMQSEVVENLKSFLNALPSSYVAVRSSASAEDLESQSFAGQYDTFLYKQTVEEVVESVKACWASMFKPHILDYALKEVFNSPDSREFDLSDDPGTINQMMVPPKMGVLVMQMVESAKSGVCFTQNLWGESNEIMIESVYGQCEGLVSGEITPDRFVADKFSAGLIYQQLSKQTHKFVKSSNVDGVEKVPLDQGSNLGPVLSPSDLRMITLVARSVEDFYGRPQDIEWAISATGKLYILQSRAITTLGDVSSLAFIPPGEGFYTFDPTHFPRPLSPWFRENYSLEYITGPGRRTGCLMVSLTIKYIHGFSYSQPQMNPPSDALEHAAEAYWTKRLYEDDYREFCDFFKPDTESLQDELRGVNPSALSQNSLVRHVARCYDLAVEFWKRHHTYTIPTMVIVGDYMNRMAALCDKDTMETLTLLEGSSPESRGLLNHEDPLLAEMYRLLNSSEEAMKLLRSDESSSSWALDCLMHFPGRLGNIMRQVRILYGWRLAGGYDLVVPALIETPHFFLKTLLQGALEDPDVAEKSNQRVRALADEWKATIPEEKHDEFEEILDVGRKFFRIRDERGLCTDLSGVGLCRRGILEAGRRLSEYGIIFEPEHLCVATKREALSLLRGDFGLLGAKGAGGSNLDIPIPKELERRLTYIANADPNLIPRALGTPPNPPDPMKLPPNIRRTMAALDTGLLKGVWGEQREGVEDAELGDNSVKGLPASMGITEGPVCLVLKDGDLQKVKKGDVVVTYSCSASFNIVIGLCSGIVTDYGGMLSHAAIVAREYGIAAVVGTQDATAKFKDGDTVRIDTSKSMVSRISSS